VTKNYTLHILMNSPELLMNSPEPVLDESTAMSVL